MTRRGRHANEKNQHNLFITNLPQVFQYCMKDVLETLNTLDMDVLNHIHKTLADRAKSDFCQYKDRRAVQRVVAHTAAKDIWSLGLCITNGLPTRDLDKILILSQNKDKTGDADSSIDGGDASQRLVNFDNILELLQTVNSLDEKVRTIEKQITVLQNDNQLLHIRLAEKATSIDSSVESDGTVHATSPILIQSPGTVHATSPIQIHSPVATPCESECEDEMGANFELPKRQQKKIKRRRRK